MLGVTIADGGEEFSVAQTKQLVAPGDGDVGLWRGNIELAELPAAPRGLATRSASAFDAPAEDWWYPLDDDSLAKALVNLQGEFLGYLAVDSGRAAIALDLDGDRLVDRYEDADMHAIKRYAFTESGRAVAPRLAESHLADVCVGTEDIAVEPRASIRVRCSNDGTARSPNGRARNPVEVDLTGPAYCRDDGEAGLRSARLDGEERADLDQFRKDVQRYGVDKVVLGVLIGHTFPLTIGPLSDNAGVAKLLETLGGKVRDFALKQSEFTRLGTRSPNDLLKMIGLDFGERLRAVFGDARCAVETEPLNTGASYDDPHLLTFDGLAYDFHGTGEFTLLSGPGRIRVQVRYEPGGASWSRNTALAFGFDGHNIGIYARDAVAGAATIVWIDGRRQTLPPGGLNVGTTMVRSVMPQRSNADRAVLLAHSSGLQIRTEAYVKSAGLGGNRLNAYVGLPGELAGKVQGLLGDGDGTPDNDLTTTGGKDVDPSDLDGVYDVFGESWRIDPRESLFAYHADESSMGFHVRGFPRDLLDLGGLTDTERRRAKEACSAAGVSEQPFLDNCLVDVALTGDPAYAKSARAAQSAANPDTFTVKIGDRVDVGAPESGAGAIEEPGSADEYEFPGRRGTHIAVAVEHAGGVRACDIIALNPPSYSIFAPGGRELDVLSQGLHPCEARRWNLPANGIFRLRVELDRDDRIRTYGFRLIETAVQSFRLDLSAGAAIVSPGSPEKGAGKLARFGELDVYRFHGGAGDRLVVRALGLGDAECGPRGEKLVAEVFDPAGNRLELGFSHPLARFDGACRRHEFVLPEDGTYAIYVSARSDRAVRSRYSLALNLD